MNKEWKKHTKSKVHGGNIHYLARKYGSKKPIYDFSANINPLGPPPSLRSIISRELANITHYPDPDCFALINAISACIKQPHQNIVSGNET